MVHQARFTPRVTLIIASVVVPIVIICAIGASISGLASINPDNQNKTLVYPIPYSDVRVVQKVFVYVVAPLSIIIALLAIGNLKINNRRVNQVILIMCVLLVCWVFFSMWALSERYVAIPESTDSESVKDNNSANQDDLQIRTYNLQ